MQPRSIPELYVVDHWRYRAEGNANIVLMYTGPDRRFTSTMLRLRKRAAIGTTETEEQVVGPPAAIDTPTLPATTPLPLDVGQEALFGELVIGSLLGPEFVQHLMVVSLPRPFLQSLAKAIDPARPIHRQHNVVDVDQPVGFLTLDHTRFLSQQQHQMDQATLAHSSKLESSNTAKTHAPTATSVAVELKPKWGYLPDSPFIKPAHAIKRRICRFCMYQHTKIKKGHESSHSDYCPIDLFSGKEGLVQDALEALVENPQNNLRLFVDGDQKEINNTSIRQEFFDGEGSFCPQPELLMVINKILMQSPVLKRLAFLQKSLDALDVETILKFYDNVRGNAEAVPQPTFEEFQETAQAFLDMNDSALSALTAGGELVDLDEQDFATRVGFGVEDVDEVPELLQMHFIREYLLSATLKDCSILITIASASGPDHEGEDKDSEAKRATPKEFKETIHRIEVEGSWFEYKIVVIDLDPKKMSNVPFYADKDAKIVDHYLKVVGEREATCGSD